MNNSNNAKILTTSHWKTRRYHLEVLRLPG